MTQNSVFPRLRNVGSHLVTHNGQRGLVLHDPLRLSDKTIFIPQGLVAVLGLLDGANDVAAVQAKFAARTGFSVPGDVLREFIAALDEAYLLDNARAASAVRRAVDEYRAAGARPPASAGLGYPADAGGLRRLFDDYLAELDGAVAARPGVRGVLSPHIDYQRGGPVYARTWSAAAAAAREAELVVIFGTDHAGGALITPTRQSYATPYGAMPTDQGVIDRLYAVIGEDAVFASELHHRTEHSIELSLTWVHHMRGGAPCPTVPVLCGSFHDFVMERGAPSTDPVIGAAVDVLQAAAAGRRTLFVASADLAHVGPAFDTPPLGWVEKAQTRLADQKLIGAICAGDAEAFFGLLKAERDRRNVCGIAPIYLMLRALGGSEGEVVSYDRCPADERSTSIVSIAGVVLG
ncbi:MAG: AmmeMemoRadiSam system protein B [Anaerolineae bacterium]|nr:AmmeMemoRadiSam system protein B [Anaerolineae bacterium]